MSDIAKGSVIGVIVAILMLGLLMESSGLLFGPRQPPPAPTTPAPTAPAPASTGLVWSVSVIGPDGTPGTPYGEDLAAAEVPGSEAYDFCAITGISVERPGIHDRQHAHRHMFRRTRRGRQVAGEYRRLADLPGFLLPCGRGRLIVVGPKSGRAASR